MKAHNITFARCECGYSRVAEHPIPHCYSCERESYEAAFARLRADRSYTHFLGIDPYSDTIYVHGEGVTLAIEGRVDRMLRVSKVDELVRRITDLETENRDVLAENARLRRRLESAHTKGKADGNG